MRFALAIAMATLTVGLVSGPIFSQPPGDTTGFESIRMIDSSTGWAVAKDLSSGMFKLLHTTDGGIRWKDVTPASFSGRKIRAFRISVLSSDFAWVMPYGLSEPTTEIFRTADGGRTWQGITAPVAISISFINACEGWLLASDGGAMGRYPVEIYHSTDGGETWTKIAAWESSVTENMTFLDPARGWVTSWDARGPSSVVGLYVTHDGGRTWRWQNLPLPSGLTPFWIPRPRSPQFFTARDGIFPVAFSLLSDASRQDLVGIFAVVYATHDGGTTWTPSRPVSVPFSGYPHSFADAKHGWVSDGSALYVTRDSGRNWTRFKPGGPFGDVQHLEFVSSQVGWALSRTSPYLLKTHDGGRTWAPVPFTISRQ